MDPQAAGGIVRTTKGLIVGAFAIAIALSGALVALLSLGPAVHFDDWPQPPRSDERDVRGDSITRGGPAADGVRPANPRSLRGFAGLVPEETALVASAPVGDTLLTTDLQQGVGPSLRRRQVTRLRRSPRRREDSVAPRDVPAPVTPAPAPGPPTDISVVDKPGKGGGPPERRPTSPPGQEKQKPEKPEKQKQEKPGGGKDADDPQQPGHSSDSRKQVFRGTHPVVGRSHDSRSRARGRKQNR